VGKRHRSRGHVAGARGCVSRDIGRVRCLVPRG
jgi:hypothetical protein